MDNYKVYVKEMPTYINKEELFHSLPRSIIAHCTTYTDEKALLQSLYAWSSLIDTLHNDYNCSIDENTFSFQEKKPRMSINLHFNISHSHDVIAYIISKSECGIDIQKEFNNDLVATRILCDLEKKEYDNSIDKLDYLNYKWVMKEAYGKLLGIGIDTTILQSNIQTNNKKIIKIHDSNYYLSWFVKEN